MSGRRGQSFQTGLGKGRQFDVFLFSPCFWGDIAYPPDMGMRKKNQVGVHRTEFMPIRCRGTLAWRWSQEAEGAAGRCFEPV